MNEINLLDVKKIEDLELIRKILHSLRRPDYDLVTTILYEKDLNTMTPNQVINKVIAHELCNDIKTKTPSSSPTHSTLACKHLKKLKKIAIKGSSSDEEEEDVRNSSNEHENFTFDIPCRPCSFNATPESGMLSAPCTHEDYNQLKVIFCKIFRRWVVDAYVYRKHCRFRGCTVTLTL